MMTLLTTQLRSFFGGGASYIFIGLGVFLVFQYWQIDRLQTDQAKLIQERDVALAQLLEKDTVIASQSRQYQRQINSRKEQVHAEEIINAVPDSSYCAHSDAVNSALSGCASTETNPPTLTMTAQMFQCREKPEIPNNEFSDAALATYMVRLVLAHEDCTAQISTIRNHLEINGVKVTKNLNAKPIEAPKKILGLF